MEPAPNPSGVPRAWLSTVLKKSDPEPEHLRLLREETARKFTERLSGLWIHVFIATRRIALAGCALALAGIAVSMSGLLLNSQIVFLIGVLLVFLAAVSIAVSMFTYLAIIYTRFGQVSLGQLLLMVFLLGGAGTLIVSESESAKMFGIILLLINGVICISVLWQHDPLMKYKMALNEHLRKIKK